MREERQKWRELEGAKASLEEQVTSWKARFRAEAARADELAADVARLSAALMAAESAAAHNAQRAAQPSQGVRPCSLQHCPQGCVLRLQMPELWLRSCPLWLWSLLIKVYLDRLK